MRAALVCTALFLLTSCSYFPTSKESAATHKGTGITDQTCYQDCRTDLQTDEFCRARCTD